MIVTDDLLEAEVLKVSNWEIKEGINLRAGYTARSIEGNTEEWHFFLVDYMKPGGMGSTGMAWGKDNVIISMSDFLSEEAVLIALYRMSNAT